MESLKVLTLQKMPVEQLKQVFEFYWTTFSMYFHFLEARMSYFQLEKWSKKLKWNHPAARIIEIKLHRREFWGKKTKASTEIECKQKKIIITYFILGCLRELEEIRQARTQQAIRELDDYAAAGNVDVFGPQARRTVQTLQELGHNVYYMYVE